MARSRISKKAFPCGHVGYGEECHRCATGNLLLSLAEAGKKYTTFKKNPDKKRHKVWTNEQLREEAKRLLEEDRRF